MIASTLAALIIALVSPAVAVEPRHVVVRGNGSDLAGPSPVVVDLKTSIPPGDYRLVPMSGPKDAIPANVFQDGGRSYLGVVLGATKAAEASTYEMIPDRERGRGVRFRAEAGGIAITAGPDGEAPFTRYRVDAGPKPFLFPVIGPEGVAHTRSFPLENVAGEDRDHPHQRSFWFTHGKVNGVDFWAETPGHGSIRETSRPLAIGGRAVGVLKTTDDWLGPDGKKVCEDERTTRFWDLGKTRVIDFEVTLKATAGPVVFGDTKEGAFGLRVASSMDVKRKAGGRITNAEGIVDNDAWGKPSSWVDYVGPVDGKTIGIAILNHPDSYRYPTPWHVRDYGLFAANPFGSKEFGLKNTAEAALPAGGSLTLRYRVILHSGATGSAALPEAFQAYAKPPLVEIVGD